MRDQYKRYLADCAICGRRLPIRSMNKIGLTPSKLSVTYWRVLCHVCDDCLAESLDGLGLEMPRERTGREKERWTN